MREALEHLRPRQPVLVELGGQLDEVARTLVPETRRVGDVGQEPVQAVAELVEQRARVVEDEQRRLARRALGEVHDVDDDRRDVAGEPLAACAEPVIQAPERLTAARSSRRGTGRRGCRRASSPPTRARRGDRPGQVGALRRSVRPNSSPGHVERRGDHVVELQVGLDLRLVEVVIRPCAPSRRSSASPTAAISKLPPSARAASCSWSRSSPARAPAPAATPPSAAWHGVGRLRHGDRRAR